MPDLAPAKITFLKCVLANSAFAGLDGFNKTNAAGERVFVPFKFSDAVRVKMRRWKRALKEHAEEYTDLQNDLIRELSPVNQDVTLEKAEVRVEYTERVEALQKTTRDFLLPKLKLEGELFNDGKNPIPDTVLDALDPIIDDVAPVVEELKKEEGGE